MTGNDMVWGNPPLLTVSYTGDPDRQYEFSADGERRFFGRDADQCDIAIPAVDGDTELSRVAGCIWRMDDELWLRNLSMKHELTIHVPGMPPEQPLPRRAPEGRPAARSIPGESAFIRAPGGCQLLVRQQPTPHWGSAFTLSALEETTGLTSVPTNLRDVAVALCEPLLRGGQLPSSYAEIECLTGKTHRQARRDVEKIVAIYSPRIPGMQEQISRRRAADEQTLAAVGDPRLINGVWVWPQEDHHADEELRARRRALALPDYFEVAHLLVRHRLISHDDLPPETPGL